MAVEKQNAREVLEGLKGAGFEFAEIIEGNTYRDMSTMIVCPTRGGAPLDEIGRAGFIPDEVAKGWVTLVRPSNHRSGFMFIRGDEVAKAYNRGISHVLEKQNFEYILTLEDDNIVPPHALIALMQSIEFGPYDGIGGLYYMKGPIAVPMAFGRPGVLDGDGQIDLSPVNLTEALMAPLDNPKDKVVEVNGLACGCTLWRASLFKDIERPWFETFTKFDSNGNVEAMTQDMYFARKARAAGKRFAIDTRVMVGHLDPESGYIY